MIMDDVNFHILIEKEDELYSALCLELDVASQGETIPEAKENIHEAIELYLESVIEAGDEKNFVPRPAPKEEWLKYFEIESRRLKHLLARSAQGRFRMHEVVYG
jgi:predicted RNase H-like HicB family nuclease